MENVSGILTKYNGKIRERILDEINSIVDIDALSKFIVLSEKYLARMDNQNISFSKCSYGYKKLKIVLATERTIQTNSFDYLSVLKTIKSSNIPAQQKNYILDSILLQKQVVKLPELDSFIDKLSEKFVNAFRKDKTVTEAKRNIIRQALNLIKKQHTISEISHSVKREINYCQLNDSTYKAEFDTITDILDYDHILNILYSTCDNIEAETDTDIKKNAVAEVKLAINTLYENVMVTVQNMVGLFQPLLTATEQRLYQSQKR